MNTASGQRYAIVGGGMSGLSLAVALCNAGSSATIEIFEARHAPIRQSFGSFATRPTPFDAAMAVSHDQVVVLANGAVALDCRATPYRLLSGAEFQQTARLRLDHASNVRRFVGQAITQIDAQRGQLHDAQGVVGADYDWIFDARPPTQTPAWTQFFVGGQWRDTRAQRPTVLMDFDQAARTDRNECVFGYAIPLAHDQLLLQLTWFLQRDQSIPDAPLSRLHAYAATLGLSAADFVCEESGSIPMAAAAAATAQGRVIPIGTRAGWVRGATGYGFLDTQRACAAIADALRRGSSPRTIRPRAAADDWFDRIWMAALQAQPSRLRSDFERLFRDAPTGALLRFLTGEASWWDRLRIARSLPSADYLRAAWTCLRHRDQAPWI